MRTTGIIFHKRVSCSISALLVSLFLVAGCYASAPEKEMRQKKTYLYAVKGDSLFLDMYAGNNVSEQRPCVIFVFGGGFQGGERDSKSYQDYFFTLEQNGFVVISIDYRLGLKNLKPRSPEEVIKPLNDAIFMAVEDLYDATTYVVDHATEWGIDPSRIIISGSSAGAIAVLQAEYERANGNPLAEKLLPSGFRYAGVISFAGAVFKWKEDLEWKESPAPILLFHGDADASVPYEKLQFPPLGFYGSDHIVQKLKEKESPFCIYRFTGAGHEISSSPMHHNLPEILNFINEMVIAGKRLMIDSRWEVIGQPKKEKPEGLLDYIKSNFK